MDGWMMDRWYLVSYHGILFTGDEILAVIHRYLPHATMHAISVRMLDRTYVDIDHFYE